MKNRYIPVILSVIILGMAVGIIGLLFYIKNQPPTQRGIAPLVRIEDRESDNAKWGINFPNQYSTMLKTQSNNTTTKYGGSQPFSKLEKDPMLIILFKGYGFGKSYNEDRGHLNSLTDVNASPRINDKSPATCYSCKSSDNPNLWAEMGIAKYDAMKFSDMTSRINNPIGCANCHEANTMRLIVTNSSLENALKAQDKDWRQFTRQEMRTLVCANCHVEYYFKGDGKLLVLPWEKGTSIENIEAYYDNYDFFDWKHEIDQAPMVKMQHPEYELYTASSTHYNAGVSCSDCHMPYTRDGSAKFSSHDVKSPFLNANPSCSACHTDVTYVIERAKHIQDQVSETMMSTEKAIVDAINAISSADSSGSADAARLDEARKLHRSAQMRWDFIAAENSMGFHNPEEALRILATATDLARQAQLKAFEAVSPDVISAK